jgi:3-(3-hydroxy-phenyl)propionate hydroxylase
VAKRYGAADGAAYLIRPDQYVAARWRKPDRTAILAALRRAIGG